MVVTNSSVEAGIVRTVVDIDLAIFPIKAFGTLAVIVIDQIFAFSSMLARICRALIDIDVAILALKPGKTVAFEIVDQVHASCSVLARFALLALIDFRLAKPSGKTRLAVTLHAAYFSFPNPVLSVTVFLAVEPDQMFIGWYVVIHSGIPVIDVTGD